MFAHAGDDAHRLIQRDQHQICIITRLYPLPVNTHNIPNKYRRTHLGQVIVDKNFTQFDIAIGLTAGTDTAVANVFIKANG
ncbi:hypothetical protein D3C72_2364720 [compost metagenome]